MSGRGYSDVDVFVSAGCAVLLEFKRLLQSCPEPAMPLIIGNGETSSPQKKANARGTDYGSALKRV